MDVSIISNIEGSHEAAKGGSFGPRIKETYLRRKNLLIIELIVIFLEGTNY